MSDATVNVRGEILALLPERAAYWARESTLFIADPHWGKAATFRAAGIPVPSGTTQNAVSRLEAAIARTSAKRVVFLGDLLHAAEGRSEAMFSALATWRASRQELSVILVRGNHDKRAGDPPPNLSIRCEDAPYFMSPFVLAHHPAVTENGYVLAGHVHPGVYIPHGGRVPCFTFGKDCGILPAFGDFTGLALVEPSEGDQIFAVADDGVWKVY